MRIYALSVLAIVCALSTSCTPSEKEKTRIIWDTWGVPHIYTDNVEDLFFAQGWAQMNNHANLVLDLYGSARGKGSEYWGKDKLQNDVLIHTLGFNKLADEWEASQDPEIKTIFTSFIKGMNAYAEAHPEAIDEKNKVVLPLTTKDVNMHGMYVVFTLFIGGADLGRIQQWPDMGSNTFAVGSKRSASGKAMLVQNPHLPWVREYLFFESHLNLSGKSMYGATLVGFPGIIIGFNDQLGWSHTNNTIDNADTYVLDLKDGGYVLDGVRKDFEKFTTTMTIKQDDGTMADSTFTVKKTIHGPVVKTTDDKVLALRMAGLDRPNMFLQWWKMMTSASFDEFESALNMAQIPFWNVMYADKKGDIFYLFNGLVPKRSAGDWNYWNRIIPGGKSADVWTDVHAYADLPKLKNPVNGWLQNSNDPPWTSTVPTALNPDDFPAYMAPRFMGFRPQRAALMLSNDESITYQELVDYKQSTRSSVADRILDDLFAAIDKSKSSKAREAKTVLEKWDREADADSKGTVLFHTWLQKFGVQDDSNYATPWDMKSPITTPDGIADPERAVKLLEESVDEMKKKFGILDVAYGEVFRIKYHVKDLPGNGAHGSTGVVRVAWPGDTVGIRTSIRGGDSWVGIIEFGDEINAKVLLSYGNATQKDSPHFGDQLELFSKKEMRDAWFLKSDVDTHAAQIEVKVEKGFNAEIKPK